jgi:DNA-binding GntR family transcriptional regulator
MLLRSRTIFHVPHALEDWCAANSCHRSMLDALARHEVAAAVEALRRDIDEAAAALELMLVWGAVTTGDAALLKAPKSDS